MSVTYIDIYIFISYIILGKNLSIESNLSIFLNNFKYLIIFSHFPLDILDESSDDDDSSGSGDSSAESSSDEEGEGRFLI